MEDDIRDQLRLAVEMGNMQKFIYLCDHVGSFDIHLASHLQGLAEQYDYGTLLEIL